MLFWQYLQIYKMIGNFFYFDDEIIGMFTLPRSKAAALIQINIKSADQELNDEIEVMEPLPKRQKLKHVTNIRY